MSNDYRQPYASTLPVHLSLEDVDLSLLDVEVVACLVELAAQSAALLAGLQSSLRLLLYRPVLLLQTLTKLLHL